jgi:hypothetical protein
VIAARRRQLGTFERIEHAQQVLALAKDDLRGAVRGVLAFVLYQI